MNKEKRCKYIRNSLLSAITKVASDPDNCVARPGRDFTRNRKLPLSAMLQMLIGMGGSLMKELHEWFDLSAHTASISAFVHQRNKIKPEALECVFHHFLNAVSLPGEYHGYHFLAVDGSDLRLPTNSNDSFSLIKNEEGGKHYNLVHLNAMYDLVNHTYVDAAIQPKKGMNEHAALVSMVDRLKLPGKEFPIAKIKELYYRRWGIETSFRELKYAIGLASLHGKKKEFMLQEVFARLVLYNYTSLIAHSVELPKGKRVNFSVAAYFADNF